MTTYNAVSAETTCMPLNVSHRHPWFEGKTVVMEVWFDVKTRTLVPIYCDVNDGKTENGDVKH